MGGRHIPLHLSSLARFAALAGARPPSAFPKGSGDLTDRFLALAVEHGMFRAETNLRFIIAEENHGTRFIHLGAGSQSARDEAAAIVAELCAAQGCSDIATLHEGLIDAGRVPYIEVRSPEYDPFLAPLSPRLLVAYFDEGVLHEALDLANGLRRRGLGTWFFHDVKNLAKHLRLADRFGADTIVIVGGREWELAERSVAVRSTQTKNERVVPWCDVIEHLANAVHSPGPYG